MSARRGRQAYLSGLAGEDAAAALYEARGARVLARRWRRPEGEIDLIAETPDGELVFVEVKTGRAAVGRDVISPRQRRRLEQAAMRYILETDKGEAFLRFDAVFIGPDGTAEVVENAWMSEQW